MASGNRVEELESRVRELEATVDGLTDELVECKVRVRELENVVDAEVGLDKPGTRTDDPAATDREVARATEAESVGATADGAEAPKSEAPEDEDDAESDGSDIIIA